MDNVFLYRVTEDMYTNIYNELSELDKICIGAEGWSAESFRLQVKSDNGIVVSCSCDGIIIGLICGQFAADEAEILSVAVSPNYRCKGIGSRLMEEFEKQLPTETEYIFLEVRESNSAAIALYKKFGFEKISVRKNFYEKPVENAIVMKKIKQKEEI